jgi:dihydrofolate reductase
MNHCRPNPGPIALIAAMASNHVIGRDNALPWRLPADLKRFKALTMGKPILMGRRTFESIGKALPGRENFVVTRDRAYEVAGCRVFTDLDAAIAAAGERELMVIGGAQIYAQTIALAQRLHLTLVQAEVRGDVMFPEIDRAQWRVVSDETHRADERHEFEFRFVDYLRRA